MPSNIIIIPQQNGLVGMVFNLGSDMTFSCRMKPEAAEKVGNEIIKAAQELRKERKQGQRGRKER